MSSIWHLPSNRTAASTLRRKFHLREQPKKKSPQRRVLEFINDKDVRTSFAWWSSGFGLLMISGYYTWLGFTPAFSIGQGSILLLQAFLVGLMLTVYYTFALLFPAWSFKFLEIEIDDFDKEHQDAVTSALFRRSMLTQFSFLSGSLMIFLKFPSDLVGSEAPLFMATIVVFAGSLLMLFRLPRMSAFGGKESIWAYWGSVGTIGVSSWVGAVLLFQIYSYPGERTKASGWEFLVALIIVILASAWISILKKKMRWLTWVIGAFAFISALVLCNSGTMPFKATAGVLGIAIPPPVEVVLPPATCTLVKQVLTDPTRLSCDGAEAGRLTKIQILNTLGERWVVREEGKEENIVFEGKGAVIRKLPLAPSKNKNEMRR